MEAVRERRRERATHPQEGRELRDEVEQLLGLGLRRVLAEEEQQVAQLVTDGLTVRREGGHRGRGVPDELLRAAARKGQQGRQAGDGQREWKVECTSMTVTNRSCGESQLDVVLRMSSSCSAWATPATRACTVSCTVELETAEAVHQLQDKEQCRCRGGRTP